MSLLSMEKVGEWKTGQDSKRGHVRELCARDQPHITVGKLRQRPELATPDSALRERLSQWKLLSRIRLFATQWTIQSLEFSRPEYWSG